MEGFGTGIQYFALVFARILGLLFTAPILGAESVRVSTRVGLGLLLSAVLYPVSVNYLPALPPSPGGYMVMAAGQAAIGVIIGYMVTVIFAAFQMAGEIFSIQVGLSFSEVLDPQSQVSIPIVGTLKNTIAMLLFLTVDFEVDGVYVPAYLHMIRALSYSFKMAPEILPSIQMSGGLLNYMDQLMGVMLLTALKIGIPVMGILFISSVALGLLGRAAPQMNLMNMGIQINIIVGFFVLLTVMPVVIPLMREAFYGIFDQLGDMFRHWPSG